MIKPIVIGIAGGSGSGKTSILQDLKKVLGESVCTVSQDNYYFPIERQQKDANGEVNFDLPEAIHSRKLVQDIETLSQGKSIQIEEYTFNNAVKEKKHITLHAAPIIIVEGLFTFHFKEVWDLLDLSVFVAAKPEIRLERRIGRDAEERGYNREVVQYQWDNHVEPAYEKYLKHFESEVDIVIPNNTNYQKGLEVLLAYLKSKKAESH